MVDSDDVCCQVQKLYDFIGVVSGNGKNRTLRKRRSWNPALEHRNRHAKVLVFVPRRDTVDQKFFVGSICYRSSVACGRLPVPLVNALLSAPVPSRQDWPSRPHGNSIRGAQSSMASLQCPSWFGILIACTAPSGTCARLRWTR